MKLISKSILCLWIVLSLIIPVKVKGLEDGAYVTGRSASYVNPVTGTTSDGGSNIALGDSMCASITENQLLIEVVNGKIYATIGLGLASNVSNVRFNLMNNDGSTYPVSSTLTGSSYNNGDTVNHYRIELAYLGQWISPIIYVGPMGRDVQFFIQSDQNLVAGTGVYNSLMVPQQTTPVEPQQQPTVDTPVIETPEVNTTEESQEPIEMVVTPVTKEELFDQVQGLSIHEVQAKESSSSNLFLYVALAGVIIALGGWCYVKKIKK